MSGKLEAALAWARRGFRVFPLQVDSKLPLEMSWTLHATRDEAVIRGWWIDPVLGCERDYNVASLTTDWIVADIDVKDGKPGLETMARLGLAFDTLCVRTPSNGFHTYYRGLREPTGQSPLGLGIDIRSHQGYVVAPGSTIDGVPYVVEIDQPVLEFPEHLRQLLKVPRRRTDVVPADVDLDAPETVEIVAHWLLHDAQPAVEGENGDDTTYRVCCRIRDFGISESQALDLFLDEYNPRCLPEWSVDEARLKIENAYRYATGAAGASSPMAAFGHVTNSPPPLVADPLASPALVGLAEKTAADAGAPFQPEALKALAALKSGNRAGFEVLRAQLKKAGCRVTALGDAIAEESGDAGGRGPTQADILIRLAEAAELFHTADGVGFADLTINGHRETWQIRARGFRRWLARCFFEETRGAPNSEALQSALNVIEAKAHFDAPERAVYVRVGEIDERLYLDLGDETWRAIEIDPTGWRVIDNPPVRFRRASGMKALPIPSSGGTIEILRPFLNVQTDADFVLVVSWALACLRNRGPYPVIVLSGEQGSAKSTFSAIVRALLDPNTAPLRALPREDRDLFIAASNGHVLAFDNVSGLPAWISDTLCRLATGGGFAVRQLYSDQDEVLFERRTAGDTEWDRGYSHAAGPCRSCRVSYTRTDPGRAPPPGKGIVGGVRTRATSHSWLVARRGGEGPRRAATHNARKAASNGRFRLMGNGLRDRAVACGHVLDSLLR